MHSWFSSHTAGEVTAVEWFVRLECVSLAGWLLLRLCFFALLVVDEGGGCGWGGGRGVALQAAELSVKKAPFTTDAQMQSA